MLAPLFALAAAFAAACGSASEQAKKPEEPPTVTATEVTRGAVEVWEDYAGRVRGARQVQVRARVEGLVEERAYVEGQVVAEGDLLFRIDPEPFRAALAQAEAERARARARLEQTRRDWRRISALFEQDVASSRDRDDARSALELAEAELALADARVRAARIDLGYTRVEAPASGITSLEVLPEGSLAARGDLLTTITQLDPIHVRFSLPEEDARLLDEARHVARAGEGEAGEADGERRAVLVLPDGRRHAREGVVDFTEASIDPATGTVRARAVFPNPDHTLTPGSFVRVALRTDVLQNVAVIPERAVLTSEQGPSVFVVREDGRAEEVPVDLGPVVPEGQVVLAGLSDGDRVVVSALARVEDGTQVVIEGRERDVGTRSAG